MIVFSSAPKRAKPRRAITVSHLSYLGVFPSARWLKRTTEVWYKVLHTCGSALAPAALVAPGSRRHVRLSSTWPSSSNPPTGGSIHPQFGPLPRDASAGSLPPFLFSSLFQFICIYSIHSKPARSQIFSFVSRRTTKTCTPVPHTVALLSLASEPLEIWHHLRFQAAKVQTALLFTDLANSPPVKLRRAMARASTPQGSLRQRGGASKQTLSESTFAPEVELDKLSKAAASSRQNVQRGEIEHKIALTLVTILGFVTRFWGISHPDEVVFDEVHFGKVRTIFASWLDTIWLEITRKLTGQLLSLLRTTSSEPTFSMFTLLLPSCSSPLLAGWLDMTATSTSKTSATPTSPTKFPTSLSEPCPPSSVH